jgi:hypothetical protein
MPPCNEEDRATKQIVEIPNPKGCRLPAGRVGRKEKEAR